MCEWKETQKVFFNRYLSIQFRSYYNYKIKKQLVKKIFKKDRENNSNLEIIQMSISRKMDKEIVAYPCNEMAFSNKKK